MNTREVDNMKLEVIESSDVRNMWASALFHILHSGKKIVADETNHVLTLDKTIVMDYDYSAVKQIEHRIVHPLYPLGPHSIDSYVDQFTYEFVRNHNALPDDEQFSYLYMDRFINYPCDYSGTIIDQLTNIAESIRVQGINRRHQLITWIPWKDMMSSDPPCLQNIWIRPLAGKQHEIKPLEVVMFWRSRDFYGAVPANLIGLVSMINRYICGDEFYISKLTDISCSGHIYEDDWGVAGKVKPIAIY